MVEISYNADITPLCACGCNGIIQNKKKGCEFSVNRKE